MITIGIATWTGDIGLNFGSALQTMAMQELVKRCKCKPITFNPGFLHAGGRKRLIDKILMRGEKYIKTLNTFHKWYRKNVILSKRYFNEEALIRFVSRKCQILLCGSDNIWSDEFIRPIFLWDYEELSLPVIAYGPSMPGRKTYDKERALKKFVAISGREKEVAEALGAYTDKEIIRVLDPTLAVEEAFWEERAGKSLIEGEYVLCYFFSEEEFHYISIEKIREKYNVDKVVYINSDHLAENVKKEKKTDYRGCDYKEPVGPGEFLSLIRHAKVVCTDSYHGSIFSVVFRKDFYVFSRSKVYGARDCRFSNFFECLGLDNRFVIYNRDIDSMPVIDWENVKKRLDAESDMLPSK